MNCFRIVILVLSALMLFGCGEDEPTYKTRFDNQAHVDSQNAPAGSASASTSSTKLTQHPRKAVEDLAEEQEADLVPMTNVDKAKYHFGQGKKSFFGFFDWLGLNALWLLCIFAAGVSPWVIKAVVTGWQFGRLEMPIEGVWMVAVGLVLRHVALLYNMPEILLVAWLAGILPGIGLFIWGCVSNKEWIKDVLFGLITFSLAAYLGILAFLLLAEGLVVHSFAMFCLLVLMFYIVRGAFSKTARV